ncbi:MAG: hypothetical protein M1820_010628 [Bogoriella megaspora]|nr:MAG: hypothetical protein M1820_010628 [Bogoriella megaspora]
MVLTTPQTLNTFSLLIHPRQLSTSLTEPIVKAPIAPPSLPEHGAAFVFLHGLGDDAHGWESVAIQFQKANKLPYLRWIFPNAPENHEAMQQAWYTPTKLSPFPSSRPELDDDEDKEGLQKSVAYVDTLIDTLVNRGFPPDRIVLGGFSQGCAVTLLSGLTSKYAGRLAGWVCLSGYLPLDGEIQNLRARAGLHATVGEMPIFLARGLKDTLVPRRYLSLALDKLRGLDVNEAALEVHEYEGLGHAASGEELRDLCVWLERLILALE